MCDETNEKKAHKIMKEFLSDEIILENLDVNLLRWFRMKQQICVECKETIKKLESRQFEGNVVCLKCWNKKMYSCDGFKS